MPMGSRRCGTSPVAAPAAVGGAGPTYGAGGVFMGIGPAGRWALVNASAPEVDSLEELAETAAEVLLARYGVFFRDLMARESIALPWREILRALRRMEARGTVRGGRFVSGVVGEQYALPAAVEALRAVRRRIKAGERIFVSTVDPCQLGRHRAAGGQGDGARR